MMAGYNSQSPENTLGPQLLKINQINKKPFRKYATTQSHLVNEISIGQTLGLNDSVRFDVS